MTSIEEIKDILNSDSFNLEYNNYRRNINENSIIELLDNIETNKNYFKLGITKYKKKGFVMNNDTLLIKNAISNLNKLTDDNYDEISEKLRDLNNDVMEVVIENIIEKSLNHHIYIKLYVLCIKKMNNNDIKRIVKKEILKYKNKLFYDNDISNNDNYNKLCDWNRKIDDITGYSILISYLENEGIIDGILNDILKIVFDDMNDNNSNLYKLIICVYNIINISKDLDEVYINKLKELKKKKIESKIRFKIMDIEDILNI